jgi:hypothetical protein
VVPLLCEQGRAAGMGDASDGVSATDGRDRGEVGLSDSGRGVREKRERDMHRWGADMHAREAQCWAAQFKPDLKQNPDSIGSKHFQTVSNFGRLEKYFSMLKKLKI